MLSFAFCVSAYLSLTIRQVSCLCIPTFELVLVVSHILRFDFSMWHLYLHLLLLKLWWLAPNSLQVCYSEARRKERNSEAELSPSWFLPSYLLVLIFRFYGINWLYFASLCRPRVSRVYIALVFSFALYSLAIGCEWLRLFLVSRMSPLWCFFLLSLRN